jgi:hypothetical protein
MDARLAATTLQVNPLDGSSTWDHIPEDSASCPSVFREPRTADVGSEDLTAVVVKSTIFWDITQCGPLKVYRRFGGTCRLHLPVDFLLGVFFDPEDGGHIFLRNVG